MNSAHNGLWHTWYNVIECHSNDLCVTFKMTVGVSASASYQWLNWKYQLTYQSTNEWINNWISQSQGSTEQTIRALLASQSANHKPHIVGCIAVTKGLIGLTFDSHTHSLVAIMSLYCCLSVCLHTDSDITWSWLRWEVNHHIQYSTSLSCLLYTSPSPRD